LTVFTLLLAKIASKALVKFGVAVPDDEMRRRGPVTEVHDRVAGLLGSPCGDQVGGHAEDVHAVGGGAAGTAA
jgi:hypothetical protein